MISPIIIGAPEAAGRTRQGTFAPAQPCATRDSAQIKFSSTRVASTASQKAGYRIRVGKRAGDRQCRFPLKSDPASSGKNLPASFQSAHASRAACDLADRAYENERAKHAPDTALVRFADAVAGKASEKEDAK